MANEITYTDEALLRLMENGDREAFSALYRRYWETLFVTAVKVIQDREEAADIVQEIFLSIWNRRYTLSVSGSLAAYLQTSIRYKATQHIAKNITRRNYLATLNKLAEERSAAHPEMLLQVKELQQAVDHVVATMPQKMREVFLLSRQDLLSHKEIASRLGISEETVKKHIQHALRLIKRAVGQTPVPLTGLLLHYLF